MDKPLDAKPAKVYPVAKICKNLAKMEVNLVTKTVSKNTLIALSRMPGDHKLDEPGLIMSVSPKGKAVYRYRFTLAKQNRNGTLGPADPAVRGGLEYSEAVEELERIKEAVRREADAAGRTVADALAVVFGNKSLSPRTVEGYKDTASRLPKDVLSADAAKVSAERWLAVLEGVQMRSESQARQAFYIVRAAYQALRDLKLVKDSPVEGGLFSNRFGNPPSRAIKRETMLELQHIAAFFKALEKISNARATSGPDALRVMFWTGWRYNAVLQLRAQDFDVPARAYRVPAGGEGWKGFVGEVNFGYKAAELLERLCLEATRHHPGGWLFPAAEIGSKLPYMRNVYAGIKATSKATGTKLIPHDLRRTFITVGQIATGNELAVGRLAGHNNRLPEVPGKVAKGSSISAQYSIAMRRAQAAIADKVNSALAQLAGFEEMTDETKSLFGL